MCKFKRVEYTEGKIYNFESEYFKCVDGILFKCFKSGYIKDQETPTHIAHYGKVFKKLTAEESVACSVSIAKKMEMFRHDRARRVLQ